MSITILPPVRTSHINPVDNSGRIDFRDVRTVQNRPYLLPAPHRRYQINSHSVVLIDRLGPSSFIRPDSGHGIPLGLGSGVILEAFQFAMNKLHGKIVSKMNDESMLAVNYAERKQTLSMMELRLMQIYRFSRDLRAGRIVSAARQINLAGSEPRVVKISKKYGSSIRKAKTSNQRYREFGNAFLEFHFGWDPLVHDIYNCSQTLSRPVEPLSVRVSTYESFASSTKLNAQEAFNCNPGIDGFHNESLTGKLRGFAGCFMHVSNPDLYLANRLGLVNPASVAWELVPFSFVIDWFANVGQFISQFSDFAGVEVKDPYHGYSASATYFCSYKARWFCSNAQPFFGETFVKDGILAERYLGLPSVTLKCRLPPKLSLWRAGTAISLLLQKLR